MSQGVEEAEEVVDVDMGVAVAVAGVVVVDLTERQPLRTPLAIVDFPVFKAPLRS